MTEPNYDEIRRRIQNRFNKRKELLMHLTAYIGVNLVIWVLWYMGLIDILSLDIAGIPLPIIVTVGWGVGLLIHFLDYYYEAGGGAERRERAIQQAIEREMALRRGEDYVEKPKRDPRLQLTEDGELEEISDEDGTPYEQQRRR